MRFYEKLLEILESSGVEHVFGVPGDALNPLLDALRERDRIRWVRVAHEEGGAFAASGASKLDGRLHVCAGTVGPGALHLINGLADARADHAPVLAILGQVPGRYRDSAYHQELDLRRIFAPVVDHLAEVSDPASAPYVLVEAVHQAVTRPGVSALIVPEEVGEARVEEREVRTLGPEDLGSLHAPEARLGTALAWMRSARRVTVLAGVGTRGAEQDVLRLAERLGAPLIRSLKAKDLYPDDHPLVTGELGLIGALPSVSVMKDADLLLMLGTDFPYREWLSADAKVIQVDRRAEVLGRRSPGALGVHAETSTFLERALAALPDAPEGEEARELDRARLAAAAWSKGMRHLEQLDRSEDVIHPQAVAAALGELAAPDAVFTCDTGAVTVWTARHLRLRPGQRLTFCANLGSMAYALPAAVGSQLAAPERQVVSISGDGGFNMLMGELLTAVRYELPIKVVIFDNQKAGLILMEQESEGYPEFGTGQTNPDYAALARSMGAAGFAVESPGRLREVLAEALATEGPVLVAVRVAGDELTLPPKVTLSQAWSFGLAKSKELLGG